MKTLFLTAIISILFSTSVYSQDPQYRKDDRSPNEILDRGNQYQVNSISELDILKALEMVGVRIFDIPFSPVFDKGYRFFLQLDEYAGGEKTNSRSIPFNNTYRYVKDSIMYFDYMPKLTIFAHDNDTVQTLQISFYGGAMGGIKLNKKKERASQSYLWRAYSKKDWKLNEEVPLLVYGSTWYDARFNIERFCAVIDLSLSEEATQELFDNSPHYFVLSLKVYE